MSKKNDVYAFGITLLETVGSIRMFKPPGECRLDEWAWTAWEDGVIEGLFDSMLYDQSQLTEIKRCVEVGLLCAQRDPANRPIMADVLQMLCGPKRFRGICRCPSEDRLLPILHVLPASFCPVRRVKPQMRYKDEGE